MKLLVLGGNCFSGKAFSGLARLRGDDVLCLSRPAWDMNGDHAAVYDALADGYRHVVNFVALNQVAPSWDYAPDYYRTNLIGLSRLADALLAGGVRRFLQVSTPEVYGTTGVFLTEDAPFNPSTPYAISRAAGDFHLAALCKVKGLPVMFSRTVNVYGPGQQPYRIIPKTALCALRGQRLPLEGGGLSTRSFIHINDAAAAYHRILVAGRPGETYHCATPRQTRIRDLVAMVCERAGARMQDVVTEVTDRPGKDMAYQLNDAKLRTELGWRDLIPLEQGLDQAVAWALAEGRDTVAVNMEYQHRP